MEPIAEDKIEQVMELYALGLTRGDIVEQTGVSRSSIDRYLKAAGLTGQHSYERITEVEAELVQYFHSEGRTQEEIAQRLGLSRTSVQRCLSAAAGKPRKYAAKPVKPARKEGSRMGLHKSQRTLEAQALLLRLILVSETQVFHQSYGWVRAIPSKDTQRLLQSLGLLMAGEVSGKRDYGKRVLHGTDMRSGRFGDKYYTFIDPDVIHGRNSKGTTATLSSSSRNPAA